MMMLLLILWFGYLVLIEFLFRKWYMKGAPADIPRDHPFPFWFHCLGAIPAAGLAILTCYIFNGILA